MGLPNGNGGDYGIGEPKDEQELDGPKPFSLGPELDREMGEEFSPERAQPLFLSEVAFLLGKTVEQHSSAAFRGEINPVLKKAYNYAEKFDAFKSAETAMSVREQLSGVKPELHPFEIAQLATLVPETSEEAKVVIPSLANKFDDDVLQDVLNALATLRQ
jgi:DNA-directed RNA polymerase II subunit RPB4